MTLRNRLKYIKTKYSDQYTIINEQETITYFQLPIMVDKCRHNLSFSHIPILIRVNCKLKAIVLMLTAIENDIPFIPVDSDKSDAAVTEMLSPQIELYELFDRPTLLSLLAPYDKALKS